MLDNVTKDKFKDSFDEDQLLTQYLFADFQRKDIFDEYDELVEVAPFVYEAAPDVDAVRKIVMTKLAAYNEKNASKKMNLVIFDDALFHLLRICRVTNSPSGSILLVGVGGSGKQSLTKLSAFICKHLFFQISITKTYGDNQLKDDIRELYEQCGPLGGSASFIMTDAEVKKDSFLEAINSMLATGEIPGLHGKEDREMIPQTIRQVYMKEVGTKGEDPSLNTLWKFFINRVKDNLHVILAFSPANTKFRERAQKFPSLFSQCSIDYFLPWPEEALISVSQKFLNDFTIECSAATKKELMVHMGKVHNMVSDVCGQYLQKMRKFVYVTPKSYLAFIDMYQDLYKQKFDAIDSDESTINSGLSRLAEAAEGVEVLKQDLKKETQVVQQKRGEVDKLMKVLDAKSIDAAKKAEEVNATKNKCEAQSEAISQEKEDAERDLAQAMPFVRASEAAVKSIDKKDIGEIKNQKPLDTTRLVFDVVNILFHAQLVPISVKAYTMLKVETQFVTDSFDEYIKPVTLVGDFLGRLMYFSDKEKDNINEETIELMAPYLELKCASGKSEGQLLFHHDTAKMANGALVGLTKWARAMSDYHKASKIVKPKLILLTQKEGELQAALAALAEAEEQLKEVNDTKAALKAEFDTAFSEKTALEESARKTEKKMNQANKLINSLEDNKIRWMGQSAGFKSLKKQLVGDTAKACAFVCYCGPFNTEFR